MSLTISVESQLEGIAREAWDRLIAQCPDSTVFQSYAWIASWSRVFADPSSIRVFAAYEAHELVGLAPLFLSQRSGLTLARQRLCFLGEAHSDYLTFPSVGSSPRIIHYLLDEIDRLTPANVGIDLGEIPETSTLAVCLTERSSRGAASIFAGSRVVCPLLDIRDNDVGVERALRKESVRRQEGKLRSLGDLTMEHITEPDAVEPCLEAFFEQHVRRWSSTRYPSLFQRPRNREFYRLFVRELGASGHVIFSVLRLDGRPIAQHLGMISGQDLLWYKPSFDLAFARYSPGQVLLKFLITYARERGYRALDFTRGDEAFKFRFSSRARFNRSFLWARRPAHRWWMALEHSARTTVRRVRHALHRGSGKQKSSTTTT
jgi:CelD/BcsL family acetyltransferase involved in cellulose biosynthesis